MLYMLNSKHEYLLSFRVQHLGARRGPAPILSHMEIISKKIPLAITSNDRVGSLTYIRSNRTFRLLLHRQLEKLTGLDVRS